MELEAQECEWGALDAESLAGACFSADRVDDAISDWDLIMALLPPGWQEQARVTGALQRRRGFAGPGNLLRVLLLHLAQGISLRQTAQAAAEGDLAQVSDVAILKRLRHCGGWFAWMTQQMAETLMMPLLRAQTQLLPGRRLCAADGSMVCGPGAGSGRWRLHYLLDLPQLCCRQVQVTTERQAESLTRFNLSPGDVVLADRGFARQRGIAHVAAAQADVIVRTKLHDPPLSDAVGVPVDILA